MAQLRVAIYRTRENTKNTRGRRVAGAAAPLVVADGRARLRALGRGPRGAAVRAAPLGPRVKAKQVCDALTRYRCEGVET